MQKAIGFDLEHQSAVATPPIGDVHRTAMVIGAGSGAAHGKRDEAVVADDRACRPIEQLAV